ncbi:MAG: hypothetical protein HeimC3_16450 [Candidatus Heimdallarchaeota archaeon LC_3]|nr:MAG: hypothetical protein HeimC3_37300 [Candidatus Heimdallarchaeota archaeon LC_3]OLS21578.1 MAG: hypothetical protein HeimC3_34870 [Candidatus Heimdallarchaeota archaeon LC_3]OLS25201.1 MAG: hypothetical protein HeimC3_16450 [Candidatus Heimdallarchaeota archaeon LC_3]
MSSAFILINSETGKERFILQELRKNPYVSKAFILNGIYDLILRIEADDLESLKNIIFKHIRTIRYIEKTFTMIIES